MSVDVYHPEWLALEGHLGSRPQLTANQAVDVPVFNQMGEQLAAQWPKIEPEPDTVDEEIQPAGIRVRIYKPQNDPGDLPLIIYFHGGGYITGNLASEDPHCRILSARVPAVVVSVDYPLAPGTLLDGIIKAGLEAIEWSTHHQPPLTKSSTLLVAGGSAGASLCIQLAYHFATSSDPSRLSGLVAMFPFCAPIDTYTGPYADEHKSYSEKATDAPIITKKVMLGMKSTVQMDDTSTAHFPLLAPSSVLANFPRTYIITAEHDVCRDDGRILAKRLRDECDKGVKEDYNEQLPHYFHWFPTLNVAQECMKRCVEGVRWVVEGTKK